jgi:putative membrane protein
MSNSGSSNPGQGRAPRVFDASDPAVAAEPVRDETNARALHGPGRQPKDDAATAGEDASIPSQGSIRGHGWLRWGTLLLTALMGLAALAIGLWLTEFVSAAMARTDWVGILAFGLVVTAAVAAAAIVLRELIGLFRLGRLSQLRSDAERAFRERDIGAEGRVVRRLRAALSGRPDLAWPLARFREHEGDVRDPGDLLSLADREIMAPLDAEARRMILASSKRVSVVTALSPIAVIAVGFVLLENLGLLRRLASLYGGRPGVLGSARLARMVFIHMVATGGVALTDDLIGQFIGQDLIRRLSRRLGEGLISGALTARVGAAAVEVIRPLPFIEAQPIRMRDMVSEFLRRSPAADASK